MSQAQVAITEGLQIANDPTIGSIAENRANRDLIGIIDGKDIFPREVVCQRLSVVEGIFIEDGTWLSDGIINANHIVAGSITTTEIATDTIVAGNIASGAITADELAAGAVTTPKLAAGSVTIGKLFQSNRNWVETWEQGADETYVWTKAGNGTYTVTTADSNATMGASVLRTTSYSYWYADKELMPFDPSVLYRYRVRYRYITTPISSPGKLYVGLRVHDEDQNTIVLKTDGITAHNANLYVPVSALTPADNDWHEAIGYIQGLTVDTGSVGNSGSGATTPGSPATLHPYTKYIAPLMLINYNVDDGKQWEIDWLRIEPVGDDDDSPSIRIANGYTTISSEANGGTPSSHGVTISSSKIILYNGGNALITLDGSAGSFTIQNATTWTTKMDSNGISVKTGGSGTPGLAERVSFYNASTVEKAYIGLDNTLNDLTIYGASYISITNGADDIKVRAAPNNSGMFRFEDQRTYSGSAYAVVSVPVIAAGSESFLTSAFTAGKATTSVSWGARNGPPTAVFANAVGNSADDLFAWMESATASGATLAVRTEDNANPASTITVRWMAVWIDSESAYT